MSKSNQNMSSNQTTETLLVKPKAARKPRAKKETIVTTLDPVTSVPETEMPKVLDPLETQEKTVLSHLGNYVEAPYQIIESYFEGQHLERLVRHQIESYNHFTSYQIQRTIQMFNPVVIRSENDFVESEGKYVLEIHVNFENFKLHSPVIHENNGATKMMLPQEAKLRNFTYAPE